MPVTRLVEKEYMKYHFFFTDQSTTFLILTFTLFKLRRKPKKCPDLTKKTSLIYAS